MYKTLSLGIYGLDPGETAQWVKCLMHKHGDDQIPSTHVKAGDGSMLLQPIAGGRRQAGQLGMGTCICSPSLGAWRQTGRSQELKDQLEQKAPSLLKPRSQKEKWTMTEDDIQHQLPISIHVHMDEYTHTYMRAHNLWFKYQFLFSWRMQVSNFWK